MTDATEEKEVKTNEDAKNGQTKCPKCGATDISLNVNTGKLRCNFCRHEFEPEKSEELVKDITQVKGEVFSSASKDIEKDAQNIITLKCTSCGAEVVIDTSETTTARCHWCRNTLSINEQVPNGAVPDMVLPFSVKKEEAKSKIEEFVGERKFFANPKFRKEFNTGNIMGVYFPYMIIDANVHANFKGQGEHETRKYTVGFGDDRETVYDADLYDVERDFDLTIDDLEIESSSDKLDKENNSKTTNIINAIKPFDTKNCVKWDSNYLKGYSSEKRDVNIEALKPIVDTQIKDIARISLNNELEIKYDRGVRWDFEDIEVKGRTWKTAYMPVWLYSYLEKKGSKQLLHYVAVNARTKETIGSVPVNIPRLFLISALIEVVCIILAVTFASEDSFFNWLFLLGGIGFFMWKYLKYRNTEARHSHETETRHRILNLVKNDTFVENLKKLYDSEMKGANNRKVNG